MISKKTLATISLVIAMSATVVTPVFAADSDIYLLPNTTTPAFTKAATTSLVNQKAIGLNSQNYGYEYKGEIYNFNDVSTLFNTDSRSFTQTMTDLPTKETPVGPVTPATVVAVSSVSAINGTVTVTLSGTPTTTPVLSDFTLTQAIGLGNATTVTPTAISTTGNVVTLTVPTVAGTSSSQSIVDSAAYQSGTAVSATAYNVAAVTTVASELAKVTNASIATVPYGTDITTAGTAQATVEGLIKIFSSSRS